MPRPFLFIATFPSAPSNYGAALAAVQKLLPGYAVLGTWEGVGIFIGFAADHPPDDRQIKQAISDDRVSFWVVPLEVGAPWVAAHGDTGHNWLRRHLSPPRRP